MVMILGSGKNPEAERTPPPENCYDAGVSSMVTKPV